MSCVIKVEWHASAVKLVLERGQSGKNAPKEAQGEGMDPENCTFYQHKNEIFAFSQYRHLKGFGVVILRLRGLQNAPGRPPGGP